MAIGNTRTSWGLVARTLHWSMAVLIVGMLAVGTYMVTLPDTDFETKFAIYQWHKSFGLLLAALILLRLAWRAVQPVPALPAETSPLVRRASAISHLMLYLLMVLLPLTGYLMSATSTLGIPTVAFGVIEVPHLLGPNAELEGIFKRAHDILGKLLIALLAVHVLAALKHALVDRDGVWTRMTSGRAPQ